MGKIILFGAGLISELAEYYLNKDMNLDVAAYTVDSGFIKEDTKNGKPVIDFGEIERYFPPDSYNMFIAVSYNKVNVLREEKYKAAKDKGYNLISYISPKAVIFDNVAIGDNCFILENNVIQPFVSIGNNNTLWSGNHIGHHTVIENNCFIASHAVVSGSVRICSNCFIGINATIRDNVVISKGTVVGAGSVIMRDTKEYEVYVPERTKAGILKSHELRKL